jgi:hypothetical protein
VTALLCSLLLALADNAQYAENSLPAGIAKALGAHEGVYRVRQFHEPGRSLWVVTLPCPSGGPCRAELFLDAGKGFREVGRATGELVDADPESGIPEELSFHVPASSKETQLRWSEGKYASQQVARWFRDPLTRDRIGADELRARGLLDLQSGRFAAAGGRYALLCQDPCAVLDVETLATALLEARLFDQAEAALQRALAMPGHQLQDLTSLASLLRAEGREAAASALEERRTREDPDAGP